MRKKIIILGINGSFGILFSKLFFKEEEIFVAGVDLSNEASPLANCSAYIPSDLTVFSEEIKGLARDADLIIMCLPEHVAYHFLGLYKHHISKDTLLVDTLSVKSEITAVYHGNGFTALSLNPMFGPDLDFKGKNMIVVKIKDSDKSDWFTSRLKTWEVNFTYLTGSEHDTMTSIIQVATHAAVMAFGTVLNQPKIPVTEFLKVATPPFLNMCTLFARITSGTKNVYWNIQRENVYASEIRKAMINNLTALDKSINEGREEDFNQLIEPNTSNDKAAFKALSGNFNK